MCCIMCLQDEFIGVFSHQGALTHGDRRATESRDLSKYNFENKVGAHTHTHTQNKNAFKMYVINIESVNIAPLSILP